MSVGIVQLFVEVSPIGSYNPHSPQILGQEWVPIRDEGLTLNPFANTLERGYGFTLPASTQVNNVRFYLKEFPEFFGSSTIFTAGIYPQGREDESGPVRSVIIPCNYGQITGGGDFTPAPIFSGLTVADCLYARGDNYFVDWRMGNTVGTAPYTRNMAMWFAVNAYAGLLSGKRILGVDFLSGIDVTSQGFDIADFPQNIKTFCRTDFDSTATDTFRLPDLLSNQTPVSTIADIRMHLGDANRFFGVGSGSSAGVNQISQWTYEQLQRFEASSSNRLHMEFEESPGVAILGPLFSVEYAALEVFYCDESRVAFGSRIFNDDIPNRPSRDAFVLGMNEIKVRDSITLATNPILPAGDYTVTISESNMGDNYYASVYRSSTTLNETRQLYEIPTHPGVQVNLPFPLNENTIGTTFTAESTDLIPQLSMHTSGGVVIDISQVYGQQSAAQVYGSVIATQDIDDRFIGSLQAWPWVKYYARRFGNTVAPLRLDTGSPGVSGYGVAVQITPGEFDLLPAITDGWKAVTLNFPVPPNMGTGLIPQWRWSATGETQGNRWEVLGATAPNVSGVPFQMDVNLQFGQVPYSQRLYSATYGTPSFGAGIAEDWVPQSGPYVSSNGIGGLSLPGLSGSYASTPDNAALDIVGDIDIRGDISPTSWRPASANVIASKWGSGATLSYLFYIEVTGTINFVWSTDGTTFTAVASTIPVPIPTSGRLAVRATLDVDNGAAGRTITFYTAPTINGSYSTLGSTTIQAGVTSIFSGSAQVEVGTHTNGTSSPFMGIIHSVKILNGIGGTEVANPDFSIQAPNTRTFTDAAGRPWTINGFAAIGSTTDDPSSDAVLIFGPYSPVVSGFGVSMLSQPVSGIGLNCGIAPCGIPTAIGYNQLSWTPNTTAFLDTFNRVSANSWGTAPGFPNNSWTPTSSGSVLSTDGSAGLITLAPNFSSPAIRITNFFSSDVEVLSSYSVPSISPPLGSAASSRLYGIFTNVRNTTATGSGYSFRLSANVDGSGALDLFRNGVTVATTPSSSFPAGQHIPFNGVDWMIRLRAFGTAIRAKAWQTSVEEPDNWQLIYFDSSPVTGGEVQLSVQTQTAIGNTTAFRTNFFAVNSVTDVNTISYELQRMDAITPWQTIMLSDNPYLYYFNDYEARVDVLTSYRIRRLSTYDFPGLWSNTVTITTAAPGVSGSCLDQAHVMIFTTNERQDGSSNLAYSNAWENTVTEDFNFPEAGFTQLQPMYNRDFFTAFRPHERGGEVFSRSVLVQAAAIAPETLADFTSLRNMAWDDVSYVCVRDEDGNRWFANVTVPSGVVQNRRKLYLATVQIAEVTDTPVPYNPPTGL